MPTKDVIAVSFLYKVSDTMKAGTPQIHAHITPNTVWAAGDPIAVIKDDPRADITSEVCGFTDYVGTPAGDGWYRVTGTVACEAFGDRTFLRLFADFRQPEGTPTLGSDAYVLFDDIQIGKAVPAANPAADENLSSANLVAGGDFEDKTLGEKLGTTYDDDGWGSNAWDADSTAFVRDGSSKVLRLAGNNAVAYGTALYKMPELTAERTYRLAFDYKFIDVTDTLSWQAHVSLLNNKQAGTPGGWYTINLLTLPGVELENGYRHVEMDFTPSEFEASAISDLRSSSRSAPTTATIPVSISTTSPSTTLRTPIPCPTRCRRSSTWWTASRPWMSSPRPTRPTSRPPTMPTTP